jgi:hypothetical protein
LPDWFIRNHFLDSKPKFLEKLIKLRLRWSIANDENETLRFCPTPDCTFIYEKPGEGDDYDEDIEYFECKQCHQYICLPCNTAAHPHTSCADNKVVDKVEEAKLGEEMLKKGFKKCPWCGRYIEKTVGCNFMTCVCKKEFCFKCGAIEVEDH